MFHNRFYRLSCATRLEFKNPELIPPLNPPLMFLVIPPPSGPAPKLRDAVVVAEEGELTALASGLAFLCSNKLRKATLLNGASSDGCSLVPNFKICVPGEAASESTFSSGGGGDEEHSSPETMSSVPYRRIASASFT
jgi:hypothetical protein